MRCAIVAALVAAVLVQLPSPLQMTRLSAQNASLGTLTGFARLPADTFAEGPASGAFLDGGRRTEARFTSQPIQGFSSIAPAGDGWWWALVDNGFGTKLNSSDARLRVYRVRPTWREAGGGDGSVDVDAVFVELSDPDRQLPFRITNDNAAERILTGADLDPESMVVEGGGGFWIGDEFGPFLLHFDRQGRLLGPPVEAEGLRSPDHPLVPPADRGRVSEATVGRSRGFEGLSSLGRASRLLAMLEAGSASEGSSATAMFEVDSAQSRFTGRR